MERLPSKVQQVLSAFQNRIQSA